MELNNTQRQFLRREAHDLRARLHIGKNGVTDHILTNLDQVLTVHELVKVKLFSLGDERQSIADTIAAATGSVVVYVIGNTVILYRQQPDPELRHIELP